MFKEGHLLYNVLMIPLQKNLIVILFAKYNKTLFFKKSTPDLVTVKQQHFAGISDTLSY